jgi:hypothetical protein
LISVFKENVSMSPAFPIFGQPMHTRLAHLCYFLYLMFPVVTFALMSTHPWLQSGLLCDTRQPKTPCVCKQEFPVLISFVCGMEILLFILLVLNNSLVTAEVRHEAQKRTPADYARWIGFITYFAFYMTALACMSQSFERCSVALYFFTIASFFIRVLLALCFVFLYEQRGRDHAPLLSSPMYSPVCLRSLHL